MNIKSIYHDKLAEMELYSSEDEGGDFLLEVSNCFRGEESKDFGFLENHFLSKTLYDNLKLIYCQVAELSLSWYTKDTVDIFSKSEWLRNYQKENNLGEGFIRESLSGTINIVPYYEMFDRKKFDYLEKDGISYIPFDQHYSLEACFKADGDTVQDNIYIFNTEDPDNIIDMKIGCIKYLELAYKAKLFFNWQYAYALKDSIHNERLRKMLPVIFPFLELELNDFLNK